MLFALTLPWLSPNTAFCINTIYIYAGPGVSENCLTQTETTINFFLKSKYQIERIFPEQILNEDWEKKAALLIIPGGADIPYTHALNGLGNQKIRSYVENGGTFLGICAGAYYGAAFVDFAKDTELEVQGDRELSFFPGIVRGPILAPYKYQSEKGARAAKIFCSSLIPFEGNANILVYYNGGGYFVDASKKDKVTVLASYDIGEEFAAIVECRVGSGRAILSGVHFEYDSELLDASDNYLKPIINILRKNNQRRLDLVRYLLERLNLDSL